MSKYRNHKSGGFDSKLERERFVELQLMERAGMISDLKRQVKFELLPAQHRDGKCVERSATYIADFTYFENGQFVVEDAKGVKTREYILKRKMMLWFHNIRIREYQKGQTKWKNALKR